jgi:hypothetical protein
VGAGQNSAHLDYTSTGALTLNSGTIKDAGLNAATLTLAAPGAAGSLGANTNIVIDTTAASVTNVTSTTANATYGTGANIAITVTFSKVVNVTGTPQLALNSGGTASYTSGTGSNTLTFAYTVGAGQNSAHLDYTSTGALTLNSGTIKDAGLNAAALTLPAPGAAGSLGANTSIVINTAAAATTTTASNASANFSASNQSVTLSATVTSGAGAVNVGTVTFTVLQGVTVIGVPVTSATVTAGAASANFTLPGGTAAAVYTIQAVYNAGTGFAGSSDSTHTLTVNGAVAAGTTTTASNASANFSASDQLVTLSAVVTSGAGQVNVGTVTFTVLQGVTVIGIPVTSATVTGGAANATFTLPGGTAAAVYTIQAVYNPGAGFLGSSDSTHTLTVNGAVAAGTTTTASNASANFSASSQLVALSATVTSGAGQVNVGTVTFTVLQGVTVIGIPVTSGTVTAGAANASFTLPAGTAAAVYTIQAVYNPGAGFTGSSDSTHTLTVNGSGAAPNVTGQFTVTGGVISFNRGTQKYSQPVALTNDGADLSSVALVLDNLAAGATMLAPSGTTSATSPIGSPYTEVGPITSGSTANIVIQFTRTGTGAITYTPRVLGPGTR